jgi:internalin A
MKDVLTALQARLEQVAPESVARLRLPASDGEVEEAEARTGLSWPEELKTLYRWHDGEQSHRHVGVFGALSWWSLTQLVRDWESQVADFEELAMGDPYDIDDEAQWAEFLIRPWRVPPPSWIPFGNWTNRSVTISMDVLPGPSGQLGQLLVHDYDDFYSCTRLANSLSTYLTDLEQGLATGQIVAAQDSETQNWGWRTKDGQPFRARGYVGNVWHAAGRTGFGGVVI